MYGRTVKYCPLCGAHEFEHGEGTADDQTILECEQDIIECYEKLKELKNEPI